MSAYNTHSAPLGENKETDNISTNNDSIETIPTPVTDELLKKIISTIIFQTAHHTYKTIGREATDDDIKAIKMIVYEKKISTIDLVIFVKEVSDICIMQLKKINIVE